MEEKTIAELAEEIGKATKILNKMEAGKKKLEEKIKEFSASIDSLKLQLLAKVKTEPDFSPKYDKVFGDYSVTYFRKESTGYKNEADVLAYLEKNKFDKCISIKKSLAKTELNKELKTNTELKTALNAMLETKVSEYCTVTTDENHTRMLEHISGKAE